MKSFLERPDCRRYICKSSLDNSVGRLHQNCVTHQKFFDYHWNSSSRAYWRVKVSRWDVYKQKCYSKKQLAIRDFPEHYTRIARQWRWCAMILILAILCGIVVVLVKISAPNFLGGNYFFFLLKFIFSMVLIKTKTENKNKLRVITSLQFYILAFTSFALVLTVSN